MVYTVVMATNNPLRVQKRLLQFNQIPFAFGEVTQQSYTAAFKGEVQSYTNAAHGGYYPSLNDWGKLQTSSFDAELTFDFKGIECDEKVRYFRFIKRQLSKSGKLFATQAGNEIIWTNARIVSINEVVDAPSEKDVLRLNVSFELIDGFWRVASRTRAFIKRYCPSNFQCFDPNYCYDATDLIGMCDETGASKCIPCEMNIYDEGQRQCDDWLPMCNYSKKSLEEMFGANCANQWAINYSCELERDYFCFDVPWGRKFRLRASSNFNTTHISFCSKTDFPTEFVRIRLSGEFNNARVAMVENYTEYIQVTPTGSESPVTRGWYEELEGSYVLTKDIRVYKGKKYYEFRPDNPQYDIIDEIKVKDGTTPPYINGIMTIGFGPEIYKTDDYRNPEKNAVDISQYYSRTNTPFFQLKPGKNEFIVSGNVNKSDSYFYIEPIEITW